MSWLKRLYVRVTTRPTKPRSEPPSELDSLRRELWDVQTRLAVVEVRSELLRDDRRQHELEHAHLDLIAEVDRATASVAQLRHVLAELCDVALLKHGEGKRRPKLRVVNNEEQ